MEEVECVWKNTDSSCKSTHKPPVNNVNSSWMSYLCVRCGGGKRERQVITFVTSCDQRSLYRLTTVNTADYLASWMHRCWPLICKSDVLIYWMLHMRYFQSLVFMCVYQIWSSSCQASDPCSQQALWFKKQSADKFISFLYISLSVF